MEDDVKQSGQDRYALSQAYRWKAERDKAMQELRQLKEEVEGRIMPSGMEWPMVKRPAVSAADGDGCCEPGTYRCQEQAFTCDSCGHTVFVDKCMVDEISYLRAKGIRTLNCCCGHGWKVEPFIIVNEGDECRMLDMGYERHVNEYGATYFAPKSSCPPEVLAADGRPLEVGQTVWHVGNGVEFTVIGLPRSGEYQSVKLRLDDGSVTGFDPDQLTHELPDGWERIEEDARLKPFGYVDRVLGWDMSKSHSQNQARSAMTHDLVRRCRALAGVSD